MQEFINRWRAALLVMALLILVVAVAAAEDTGEIDVTSDIPGVPSRNDQYSTAADANGNFAIAWRQSPDTYPYESKILVRRYDSSGMVIDDEPIQVVALGSRLAGYVDVAMNDSGAFVVTWTQSFTDSEYYSVHAALFNSSGVMIEGPFQVNTTESGSEWRSAVAIDDDGNFFIVWEQGTSSGSTGQTIYGQFFDIYGEPSGDEIIVNTDTDGYKWYPDVSMAGRNGRAIVVWVSSNSRSQDLGIYAQLFTAFSDDQDNRIRDGGEVQLSPNVYGNVSPGVAMDDNGRFVAVWQYASGSIRARQFAADGSPLSDAFAVDTNDSFGERWPDIATDGAGNFVIAWESERRDGASGGVYARLYDLDGDPRGEEFRVNVRTDEDEEFPTAALSDSGHAAVGWGKNELPNDGMIGLYARILTSRPENTAPAVYAGTVYKDSFDYVEGSPFELRSASLSDPDGDELTFSWSVDSPLCTFSDPQVVNPTLTCSDDVITVVTLTASDGQTTNIGDAEVYIANKPPYLTLSGDSTVEVNEPYTVTLGEIMDPGNDTVSAVTLYWTGGSKELDLNNIPGQEVITFPEAGRAYVRAQLTDEDGTFGLSGNYWLSVEVTTANSQPTANAGGSYSGPEGSAIPLDGSSSSDPDGDPLSYLWRVNSTLCTIDDAEVVNPSLTCADNGSYQVTLEVDDGQAAATTSATVEVSNVAPTATFDAPTSVDEGNDIQLSLTNATDPSTADSAAGFEFAFDCGDGAFTPFSTSNSFACETSDNGFRVVQGIVRDKDGGETILTAEVQVLNLPPIANFASPTSVNEGSPIQLSLTSADDPSAADLAAGFTYAFDCGAGYDEFSTSSNASCATSDDGRLMVKGKVQDKDGGISEYTASVIVPNVAPTIDAILAPADPVAIDAQPVEVRVEFSDPGTADTHTTVIDWGDGTNDAFAETSLTTALHTYAEPGVFTLQVEVNDDDGGSDTAVYEYIVIYNDVGGTGFVTGHGRIDSAAGWCHFDAACENTSGKARFGFVSRYQRGATTPSGRTVFVFRDGNFDFESTTYNWLVVNQGGSNAQFRGEGLVNDTAAADGTAYQFMIWGGDGAGSNGEDTFRIKIWYEEDGQEMVVYDNGFDQPIANGNIKVRAN